MRAKGTKCPAMGGTVLPWKNRLEQNVPPLITTFQNHLPWTDRRSTEQQWVVLK